jgi:hypothetical protein
MIVLYSISPIPASSVGTRFNGISMNERGIGETVTVPCLIDER